MFLRIIKSLITDTWGKHKGWKEIMAVKESLNVIKIHVDFLGLNNISIKNIFVLKYMGYFWSHLKLLIIISIKPNFSFWNFWSSYNLYILYSQSRPYHTIDHALKLAKRKLKTWIHLFQRCLKNKMDVVSDSCRLHMQFSLFYIAWLFFTCLFSQLQL